MSITLYIYPVEFNVLLDLQVYPNIHKCISILGYC